MLVVSWVIPAFGQTVVLRGIPVPNQAGGGGGFQPTVGIDMNTAGGLDALIPDC